MKKSNNDYIIVTGMHSTGKTTLLNILYEEEYLPHFELGKPYRKQYMQQQQNALQERDLAWFDRLIFEMELERDRFLEQFVYVPHCIETWHLGNLMHRCARQAKWLHSSAY